MKPLAASPCPQKQDAVYRAFAGGKTAQHSHNGKQIAVGTRFYDACDIQGYGDGKEKYGSQDCVYFSVVEKAVAALWHKNLVHVIPP